MKMTLHAGQHAFGISTQITNAAIRAHKGTDTVINPHTQACHAIESLAADRSWR